MVIKEWEINIWIFYNWRSVQKLITVIRILGNSDPFLCTASESFTWAQRSTALNHDSNGFWMDESYTCLLYTSRCV